MHDHHPRDRRGRLPALHLASPTSPPAGSPSTSTSSTATSRCCSTPAREGCSRLVVRGGRPQVIPVDRLRWISFGHVEADECGVDERVAGRGAAAPRSLFNRARLHGLGRTTSPTAPRRRRRRRGPRHRRPSRARHPHARTCPHGWEAQVLYDETTAHPALRRPVHPDRRPPGARPRRRPGRRRRSRPRTSSAPRASPPTRPRPLAPPGRARAPHTGPHARPRLRRRLRGRAASTWPTPTRARSPLPTAAACRHEPPWTAHRRAPTSPRSRPIERDEAERLAATEYGPDGRCASRPRRRTTGPSRPTARCGTSAPWPDTSLGLMTETSRRCARWCVACRAAPGAKRAGDGPLSTAMTALQVADQRRPHDRTSSSLALAAAGPDAARWRAHTSRLLRRLPMKEEVATARRDLADGLPASTSSSPETPGCTASTSPGPPAARTS